MGARYRVRTSKRTSVSTPLWAAVVGYGIAILFVFEMLRLAFDWVGNHLLVIVLWIAAGLVGLCLLGLLIGVLKRVWNEPRRLP